MRHSWGTTFETIMEKGKYGSKEEVFRRQLQNAICSSNINNYVKCSYKRRKRFRSAFTTEQVNYLETEFKKHPYIGNARRKDVANALNIPERAVKIWFQNRRMKEKKDGTNKELDDTKNLERCGDQLRNQSITTTNVELSLPVIDAPKQLSSKTTFVNSTATIDAKLDFSVPRRVQGNSNFYKDISPAREPNSINSSPEPEPVKNELTMSNTSADFSSELFKRHSIKISTQKNLQENETALRQDVRRSPSHPLKMEQNRFVSHFPVTAMPQDLPSYKKPTGHCEHTKITPDQAQPTNMGSNVQNSDLPLYLKGFYAQPYTPPGNMIWKPVNVAPVMSTGFSASNHSHNAPVNMTIGQQNNPKSCNCDCHLKPYCSPVLFQQNNCNPQVQYVITAVPLQNPVPRF